jgi:hypothetical protein
MIKYNKKIKAYYGLSKLTEKQMSKKNVSSYIINNKLKKLILFQKKNIT